MKCNGMSISWCPPETPHATHCTCILLHSTAQQLQNCQILFKPVYDYKGFQEYSKSKKIKVKAYTSHCKYVIIVFNGLYRYWEVQLFNMSFNSVSDLQVCLAFLLTLSCSRNFRTLHHPIFQKPQLFDLGQ